MPSPVSREQHWSASRFMLFEQCPQAFKARYVDGEVSDPSLPMLFGSAVHLALEALHQARKRLEVCTLPAWSRSIRSRTLS